MKDKRQDKREPEDIQQTDYSNNRVHPVSHRKDER
jgi:hypothetical protein